VALGLAQGAFEKAVAFVKERKQFGRPRAPTRVPWRDVRGMSNFVRHQYDEINVDLIWTTATESIFPIRNVAKQEIARLEGPVEDS
jgi:uncharacterized protein with HEPN domain